MELSCATRGGLCGRGRGRERSRLLFLAALESPRSWCVIVMTHPLPAPGWVRKGVSSHTRRPFLYVFALGRWFRRPVHCACVPFGTECGRAVAFLPALLRNLGSRSGAADRGNAGVTGRMVLGRASRPRANLHPLFPGGLDPQPKCGLRLREARQTIILRQSLWVAGKSRRERMRGPKKSW